MSSPDRRVRLGRSVQPIAVTRPGGPIAGAVAGRWVGRGGQVVALQGDLASPLVGAELGGVDALVHVVTPTDLSRDQAEDPSARRDRLVREVRTLLLACAANAVSQLVVVTAAQIYGAAVDNPTPMPANSPLRARGHDGLIADLVAVEQALAEVGPAYPAVRIAVLRPASVVGGVDTVTTRHFTAPRLLRVAGGAPTWQFCHVEDLAAAVEVTIDVGLAGPLPVGAPGYLTQAEIEERSGMRPVEVGASTAGAIASRLHRLGTLKSPESDLDFVTHPLVVDSAALLAAGWEPTYDNALCLAVLLEDAAGHRRATPRFGARDAAALGAASAAVAVGATAAIMRRRRRKG
ncbi:MAG: NAD-dependent epimerase/dehydratase family protein [Actinomycetota bacterium]|nr:NAD-dependent epimerase/dehydratase family protein [Actinomycetota bacterium]